MEKKTEELTGSISRILAGELKMRGEHADNVIALLDEGCTIPFIARYRKEMHGSTDDQTLRAFAERLEYLRKLDSRREEILRAMEGQGVLTPELREAVLRAASLSEAEDVYRPFRPKRRTRASIAGEKGLGPLADQLFGQAPELPDPAVLAKAYVDPEKGVSSAEEALAGASDILAERISDDPEIRGALRALYRTAGVLLCEAAGEGDSVYRGYYGSREPVGKIPGHRVLAIDRGEREGFLKVRLEAPEDAALREIRRHTVRPVSASNRFVAAAGEDAWKRLLASSLEREIRSDLTEAAAESAIRTFAGNLRPLLMQPPLKGRVVMGFDPAYRTGCKIAVVDPTGKVLETGVVYPTPPHSRTEEAKETLSAMIRRHGVTAVAIGNGTASKESEVFIAGLLREHPGVSYMVVSEAGASVYSASPLGAEEFPQFDVSLRSAVSIARRLQDPLSELVKIDPRSIGVGQYQHDMPQARLRDSLRNVVEDCVNAVGVDLNTASPSLLSYVSGLSPAVAKNITAWRDENGAFASRSQLRSVPRLGPKAFEQCAGFLRIPGAENVLDSTGVHPESYPAAEKLLAVCGYSLDDAAEGRIGLLRERLSRFGEEKAAAWCGVGLPTLHDITADLLRPGRDPRDELPQPMLRTDVMTMADLKPGLRLKGTVRNVADFGAFVDIGVHQDGLVHVSRLADRFVRNPRDVVRVGDVVEVIVLETDAKKGRISLSMRPSDMA